MKLSYRVAALGVLAALVLGTVGPVQRTLAQGMQHFFPLIGTEQISLNYPCTVSCYATTSDLSAYALSQPGSNGENELIGGDFGKNLFQDGTAVTTITTTPTYVADQWAAFSGTSTTIAGNQETGASDIPANFQASLRITRSGAGILQSCVAQEVLGADSYRFQGQTAEIDFHALAGSGFSAAGSLLSVYLVQGTGADEGMANLAHTINSALGGSFWTGYSVAAVANATVKISTTWTRYSVVVPVAATTTELGVVLCYTPVGASPSSDWFEFTGIQLVPNAALKSLAGTTGVALPINDARSKAFNRRTYGQEIDLQYAYYYRTNEVNGAYYASGEVTASNVESAVMPLPRSMRILPACTFTNGGLKWNINGVQVAVGTPTCTASKNQFNSVAVTDTATGTAGQGAMLTGSSTTGVIKVSARF